MHHLEGFRGAVVEDQIVPIEAGAEPLGGEAFAGGQAVGVAIEQAFELVGRDAEAGGAGGITVLRAVEAEEAAGQQGLGGVEEAPHGEAALAVAAGEQE